MKGARAKDLLSLVRQYFLLIIAAGLLIIIARFGWLNPILNLAQDASLPLQVGFTQTFKNASNTIQTINQIGSLREQNAKLQIANAKLKAANSALQKLKTDNDSLRTQLKTPLETTKIKLAARAIGNSGLGTKNVLLIDQGSNNKVKEGDLVVVQNILLGKVIAVSPHISSVQLLTDPDTKIPVVTPDGQEGILEGEFGSTIALTNILQNVNLKKGEIITTSGKDNYPPGLVVGEIGTISKIEKEFYQKATIDPLVEIHDLDLVYLIDSN